MSNECYQTFPRASRDNPLRSIGSVSGPYFPPGKRFMARVVDGAGYVVGTLLLLSMFFAPEFWLAVAGAVK